MAFFSFSCFKSYYYLLIFWILDLSIVIVRDLYLEKEIAGPEYLKGTEFIYISCLNIADLFACFLVFHTYFKMRKINTKNKEMESEDGEESKKEKKKKKINKDKKVKKNIKLSYELIYNDNSIKNNKYIYLFIISLLEFLARSTDLLFLLILKTKMPIRPGEINWLISIDFFSRVLFSNLILKTKLYKHHIFSIILIIIGLLSMSICAFKAIVERELENWPYFLFIVVKYLLLPLEDVINKILLTNEFLLPHYLMFYRGIFNFFMLIILGTSVIIPEFVKFECFSRFQEKMEIFTQILMKIIFTIFSFCKAFCLLKVIDIFSPQHVSFLNTAFSLYQLIKCRYKSKDNIILTIIDAFFLIVIIFATLVFNEILIINRCGLNKNTKIEFLIKEKKEIENIKSTNDTDDDLYYDDNEEDKIETKK